MDRARKLNERRVKLSNRYFANFRQELDMNQDQVKGNMKDAAGKVQEKAGQVFDSKEQQAKGLKKQVEGKTQETWGDTKDAMDDK